MKTQNPRAKKCKIFAILILGALALSGCDTPKESQEAAIANCSSNGGVAVLWWNTTLAQYESICRKEAQDWDEKDLVTLDGLDLS